MLQYLAENNFGDTRSGGLAGPTGLVIILLLLVGTVLLIRNMNSRLRRLPERFPASPGSDAGPAGGKDGDPDGDDAATVAPSSPAPPPA